MREIGCGACDRQAYAQDGIGAQLVLVRRAVQVEHGLVHGGLVERIFALQALGDRAVDVGYGFQDALAAIALLIAIAQLQRLVDAGGGAGGDSGARRTRRLQA